MSSNSIRAGAEIFKAAREASALMSRSSAQQIEHWARIGAALEACGLTVGQVTALLQSHADEQNEQGDASLWAFKRQRQQADLENAQSGRVSLDELSWFSGGKVSCSGHEGTYRISGREESFCDRRATSAPDASVLGGAG